jgi:para-aminobenzoate synthetase/4-amino-4-deoxychorismate lyase
MQLLAELEDRPRGVYTGAIGYFSRERTVFNVAIRTLELDGNVGTMGVGSGIVIDSDAKDEYQECLLKAEFSLIETMLWDGGYPLLELHLDRLQDSAEYFGFECQRAAITAAVEDRALGFAKPEPRKVRLLLNGNGELEITDELLPLQSNQVRIGRVRIAPNRTDSADPWLYHKTTQRPLYAQAFKAALDAGFDDVLFMNERGELTEGAISNVFIEKAGKWLTPPVESGLLAGVYRRHLLETRPNAEERVLYPDDLRRADAVYLCNALRGLRQVKIDWNS